MANGFGKACRLLKTEDFSSVFALKRQRSRQLIQVFYADHASGPRLGLVVGKKAAKRANRRNFMKRVIREWFRLHQQSLPPQDFVVRVRQAFDRSNADQARAELAELLGTPPRRQPENPDIPAADTVSGSLKKAA